MSLYEQVGRPQSSFSGFLWRALSQIWDALNSNNYYAALERAVSLVIFLPDPVKKEFKERAEKIELELNNANRLDGVDLYLRSRNRRQYLRRYSSQTLKPFLSELVSALDKRHYLEQGSIGPRKRSKHSKMGVPNFPPQ